MTARVIDESIEIAASPEAVWRAITEEEEMRRWLAPEVRGQDDGKIWISWGPGMEGEAQIKLAVPRSHLLQIWPSGTIPSVEMAVDYRLERKAGATVLRLTQSGFGEEDIWDEEYESTRRGWRLFLLNLRHSLERRAGVACRYETFGLLTAARRDEVWSILTGHAGLAREGELGPETYRVVTAGGDALQGRVEVNTPARDLALTIENMGDSLLRISLERSSRGTFIYGALLAYGEAAAGADAFAARLQKLLEELFQPLA